MKKLLIILVLTLVCSGIKLMAGNDDLCYVKAGDKVYFGKDLKIGLIKTRIVLPDETFAEVYNRDITAYRHHDKTYLLMPVICNQSDTLCFELMEFVTSKAGYNIFRYCCSKEFDKLVDAKKNYFFVYDKEGKFCRRIDEEQTDILLSFNIKVI